MAPLLKRLDDLGSEVKALTTKLTEEAKAREKAEKELAKKIEQQEKDHRAAEAKAARDKK